MPSRSGASSGSDDFTEMDTHCNLKAMFVFHDAIVCREYRVEARQRGRGFLRTSMHGDVPTRRTA